MEQAAALTMELVAALKMKPAAAFTDGKHSGGLYGEHRRDLDIELCGGFVEQLSWRSNLGKALIQMSFFLFCFFNLILPPGSDHVWKQYT